MTEYQEITYGKTIEELESELQYQVLELGYVAGDSFPAYLIDLIAFKRDQDGRDKCGIKK